ncbi:peptide-methionine (S)-S-oxide reductase [bacterium]|nr:MAG: peptide-methionine (S)-S-oxide reductase [bacterium]
MRARAAHADAPVKGVAGYAGNAGKGTPLKAAPGHELAAFAMGCFWGSESIYRHIPGVTATSVGYTGGITKNPTYEDVCSHTTKHAEAVLVEFDPKKTSYAKLLDVFWENHDSTSGDRQGPDVGDQYRSEVFTLNDAQQKEALASRDAFGRKLSKKITTRVEPLGPFYLAEAYHQQYHEKTGTANCPFPKPPKKRGA